LLTTPWARAARLYSEDMFAYAPAPPGFKGYAVAADGFVGLISTVDAPRLPERLYQAVGLPDAQVADILDVLEEEPQPVSFAVVELIDRETRTVSITVRGEVLVDLGGTTTTRFQWPEGATWMSGHAAGVESVGIALTGHAGAPATLPIARGAIPATHVTAELVEGARKAYALPELTTVVEDTILHDAPSEASAAVTPGGAASAPDRTPVPVSLSEFAEASGWTLLFPDGKEVEASSRIVVGRKPWRNDPSETSTPYIVAPSPRKEISGKHLELSVVGDELHATDLGSTNGTVVLSQDKAPRLLRDSSVVSLRQGDTLDLGEGFRIVVGARK
jgi:hypothetical protein